MKPSQAWRVTAKDRGYLFGHRNHKPYAALVFEKGKGFVSSSEVGLVELSEGFQMLYYQCDLKHLMPRVDTTVQRIKEQNLKENLPKIQEKLGQAPGPECLSIEKTAEIISCGEGIVYTGAGISKAAGIMDETEMETFLGIDRRVSVDTYMQDMFTFPDKICERWLYFCRQLYESEPTYAHWAIKRLSKNLESEIWSENVDNLHEKSGVAAELVDTTSAEMLINKGKHAKWLLRVGHHGDPFGDITLEKRKVVV